MLSSGRSMQYKESQIQYAVLLLPLVVVTLALLVVSGCSQEEKVEKKPASPPNATVDFSGPGNRVDGNFQSGSPE